MILDGWGKSPDPKVSAIDNANIPFINSLYTKYPSAQLRTDGLNVSSGKNNIIIIFCNSANIIFTFSVSKTVTQ